jgi:uncharacterized protein (DUF1501 family)
MKISRREFMRQAGRGCLGYALGVTAFAAGVRRFGLINTLAQGTDYKALVCVFLAGGNDGNNLIVPMSTDDYEAYAAVRGPSGLAIPRDDLMPFTVTPPSINTPFGFHPGFAELKSLFDQRKLSVVCNVGPLVQPLTKEQYQSGAPRPYQLFSHSDQIAQWQTAIADRVGQSGWGGRTAERFPQPVSKFPIVTAFSGGIFARGDTTTPLTIAAAPTPLNELFVLNGFRTEVDESRRASMDFLRTIDLDATLVEGASRITQQAVDIGAMLGSDVTLETAFPDTALGNQLKQVAKLIKFNSMTPGLGVNRQIFFCQLGGFDTHQGQRATQDSLLEQVSKAVTAFYTATDVDLHLQNKITTFTLSDFGRTLQPSGSGAAVVGTDHAWGNHHFVVGGAVGGGDFYGVPGPNATVFPVLELGGPSDTDVRGRWIPTASVEQYAATLALWFGVAAADLPIVFPNIDRFGASNLGFMS